VPTTAVAESLSMAKRQADLDAMVERMLAIRPTDPELRFEVTRGVTRPVWEMSAADRALFELAKTVAGEIGFPVTPQSAGGGSDGNFTGAMGIPTLDGLGVMGRNAHTLDEHIDVSSLVPRARLFAGLLTRLPL
jgi:glutamate carboxypeptidase